MVVHIGQGTSTDSMDGRLRDMVENKIDAVIVAGWRVLENDFSESSFQEWRKRAFDCVVALCGESHPYADYFKSGVQKARKFSVLTGVGLLTAAQSGEGRMKQLKMRYGQREFTIRGRAR